MNISYVDDEMNFNQQTPNTRLAQVGGAAPDLNNGQQTPDMRMLMVTCKKASVIFLHVAAILLSRLMAYGTPQFHRAAANGIEEGTAADRSEERLKTTYSLGSLDENKFKALLEKYGDAVELEGYILDMEAHLHDTEITREMIVEFLKSYGTLPALHAYNVVFAAYESGEKQNVVPDALANGDIASITKQMLGLTTNLDYNDLFNLFQKHDVNHPVDSK